MKIKIAVIFLALTMVLVGCAKPEEAREEAYNLEVPEGTIYGTLALPEGNGPFKVAIIHPGSGPTDRDGNSAIAGSNNGLKMLAASLADAGIASVRYDKRGIAESMSLIKSENELVFENYIEDMELWMEKARADGRFSEIYLIGHSEGALISAVAASRNDISGFVSLAGVGEPAYDTLERQLSGLSSDITELISSFLNELKAGRTVSNVPNEPVIFQQLFRDSVQPYLISWFKYDPAKVYAEITAPILIIQGDNDLQVTVEDAKKLGNASGIEPIIISEMNHILKQAPTGRDENLKTYANPVLPLHPQLMEQIISFINEN